MKKLTHIELFAGCGGMTLGLEAAGFELCFANELSPMAGETFAYNLLNEDLDTLAKENKLPLKTLWIKSKFKRANLKCRLRENPFEAIEGDYSDLNAKTELKNKLLIGDIDKLLEWLEANPTIAKSLRKKDITLISGGPPCQSFSLAGKRERKNAKNLLPLSFSRVAGLIQPKFVLLENVKGITAPFTEEGKKHYAWFEVAKAFALQGYVPICMMLNSKYFGVAQNRPRFILLAIRIDLAKQLLKKRKDERLQESLNFYSIVSKNNNDIDNISMDLLKYYDLESNPSLFNGFLFPKISTTAGKFISAADAIKDLKDTSIGIKNFKVSNDYREYLNKTFDSDFDKSALYNHEPRNHSYYVKARFRLYQVINEFKNGNKKSAVNAILGKKLGKEELSKLTEELSIFEVFLQNENMEGHNKKLSTPNEVENYLISIATKKHSQRALKEKEPAPAQLTIPDDLCHYAKDQLRTLTVREMARFQSFPDWFKFRSKVTTGGISRKFEVPQYTQVGNAVPPLLAKALGESIISILKQI